MNTRFRSLLLPVLSALLMAGTACATSPRTVTDPARARALPDDGVVEVSWSDPAQFTELRFSGNRWEAERGNWVTELAQYLRTSVEKHLPAGERMEVAITDIDRAGRYDPMFGPWLDTVRIMRSIDAPSMQFSFRRYAADGTLLAEGERKLRDMMYLNNINVLSSTDPLRYEKRMIDDWTRREFQNTRIASR